MKKVLFLTDGSVDTALSLNRWLEAQTDPVALTVVSTFSIDQPLKAVVYRDARQSASEELDQWLNFLPPYVSSQHGPVSMQTEMLLGEPALVLTIHLLLRQYDYLLFCAGQAEVLSTFLACQSQINTQLQRLSGKSIQPHRQMRHDDFDVVFDRTLS